MENIIWIHWFWITVSCAINIQREVSTQTYPLIEVDGKIDAVQLSDYVKRTTQSPLQIQDKDNKLFNESGGKITDRIIFNTTKLTLNASKLITNLEKINNSHSDSMDNSKIENKNNSNIDVIYNKYYDNLNIDVNMEQNLQFKNNNKIITSINVTSNLPSIEDTAHVNILKKTLNSQEDNSNFNVNSIKTVPSKLIKSDSFFTSTSTDDPFVLDVQDNQTNLNNFLNNKRKPKGLSPEYRNNNVKFVNYSMASKNLLIRSAESIQTIHHDEGNVSSEALLYQNMDAGLISGICLAAIALSCVIAASGLILYRRRRYLNKPRALSEPDSGYIDDSIIRDTNSDELYSLDNDSFLNSLEAMTIQNYWSETVKHTKL